MRKSKTNGNASHASSKKHRYREEELYKNLKRYTDDPSSVLDKDVLDLLVPFDIMNAENRCCRVVPDGSAIRDLLVRRIQFHFPNTDLSTDETKSVAAASKAVLYVAEYLPQKLDEALQQLCDEALLALIKTTATIRRPQVKIRSLSEMANSIAEESAHSMKSRLGMRSGPPPLFLHKSDYEQVLGQAITEVVLQELPLTLENTAGVLAEILKLDAARADQVSTESIRDWNSEYGVNWLRFKAKIRESLAKQ